MSEVVVTPTQEVVPTPPAPAAPTSPAPAAPVKRRYPGVGRPAPKAELEMP